MKKKRIRKLVVIGVLGSLATVLMFLEFPLPLVPSFYKLDFSEIPVLIGAFAYGPLAGILIEAIKNILNVAIKGTQTFGVGQLANFLIGISLVVPASLIYFRKKNKKHAIIGLLVGALVMALMGALLNAYVLLPLYALVYSGPQATYTVDSFVYLGSLVNPWVKDLFSFLLFAVVPFNLIKAIASSTVVILVYKRVSHLIKTKGQ